MEINEEKVHEFGGKAMGDLGAALTTSLVVIGGKLGLYRAMACGQPTTSDRLAERTDTNERFFRRGYNANLVESWIPALEGAQKKLGSIDASRGPPAKKEVVMEANEKWVLSVT
ncbi:MAG: hypothetical protein P8R42_25315 [Candidatus Binatia bacterium]|nr:hypothetical protein [Candidatus Binatia bacterium]